MTVLDRMYTARQMAVTGGRVPFCWLLSRADWRELQAAPGAIVQRNHRAHVLGIPVEVTDQPRSRLKLRARK